jgi:hypothetical protein
MTFTHEGERFQVHLFGPVTSLCWNLKDMQLYRFTTKELREILEQAA